MVYAHFLPRARHTGCAGGGGVPEPLNKCSRLPPCRAEAGVSLGSVRSGLVAGLLAHSHAARHSGLTPGFGHSLCPQDAAFGWQETKAGQGQCPLVSVGRGVGSNHRSGTLALSVVMRAPAPWAGTPGSQLP